MIDTKIPQSIQKILDIFIRSNFYSYSYKSLADNLKLKVDTLIQRIRRNKEYFEIDDSQRPSRITIKKGLKEVYFYRDKNKCLLCDELVNPENLTLKFRNPYQDDKYDWENVLSVCDKCKDKEIIKKVKRAKKPGTFEYKEVYIRRVSKKRNDNWYYYYEFDEHDGIGVFPLLDENDKIASDTVGDILNYFGADGWDVIHIETAKESEYDEIEDYQVFFKRKREGSKISGFKS